MRAHQEQPLQPPPSPQATATKNDDGSDSSLRQELLPGTGDVSAHPGYASVSVETNNKEEDYEVGLEQEGNWCNDWGFLMIFVVVSGLMIGTGVKGLQDKYDQYDSAFCCCLLC